MNEKTDWSNPFEVIGDLVNHSKKPMGTPWLAWIVWLCLSSILVWRVLIRSRFNSSPEFVIDWIAAIAYLSAVRIAYELIVLAHAALLEKHTQEKGGSPDAVS